MTLKEAIEISLIEDRRSYPKRRLEAHIALKLLIEAGKRELLLRSEIPYDRDGLLPGETED